MARCRLRASESPSGSRCLLDSNSTRTESYVAIHHGQTVSSRVGAPKAPHQSGWQQITPPNREPGAGLKNQKGTALKTFRWNTLRSLGGRIPFADPM